MNDLKWNQLGNGLVSLSAKLPVKLKKDFHLNKLSEKKLNHMIIYKNVIRITLLYIFW